MGFLKCWLLFRVRRFSLPLLISLLSTATAHSQNSLLPAMGVWNGFNENLNVLECNNASLKPISLNVKVLSNSNEVIENKSLNLTARGTAHLLLSHPELKNAYGTYVITRMSGASGADIQLACITAIYRMAKQGSGKAVEYAYALPVRAALTGETNGVYNSMNPEPGNLQPVFNWLSLVNRSSLPFSAEVRVYNQNGSVNEAQSFQVTLLVGQRRDYALGHPSGHKVGLYRIIPTDLVQPYEAFLTRFSQKEGQFNFAFPLRATSGSCKPGPITASTMGAAFNWGEVANPTDSSVKTNITIRDSAGFVVYDAIKTLAPRSQHHIFINSFLGENNVGTFEAKCVDANTGTKKLLAQSLYYGHLTQRSPAIEWAYASQATDNFATSVHTVISSINTFMGVANWRKVLDRNSLQTQFTSSIYDQLGKPFAPNSQTMKAGGSLDIGEHQVTGSNAIGTSLGKSITANAAYSSELLRVFPNSRGGIGYIMNIPDAVIAPRSSSPYPLGFLSPLIKIYKGTRIPSNIATIDNFTNNFISGDMTLLQNEAESVQLALKSPANQSVSLNYSVSQNGEPNSDLTVELYKTDFANVTYSYYNSKAGDISPIGAYTDPLIPYLPGSTLTSQGPVFWWITVRSKDDATPGNYNIDFNISINGESVLRSLNVKVLDYLLPKQSHFKMVLNTKFEEGVNGYTPFDYHRANSNIRKKQVAAAYLDYLSKNRINHSTPFYDPDCESCSFNYPGAMSLPVTGLNLAANTIDIDFTSFDRLGERYFDAGNMNFLRVFSSSWGFYHFHLPLLYGDQIIAQSDFPRYSQIQRLYWNSFSNHLAQKGWLDNSFVYIDEPFAPTRNGTFIPYDNAFTDILKSVSPKTSVVALLDNHAINFTNLIGTMKNIDYYAPIEYVPEYLWPPEQPNPLRVLMPTIKSVMDETDKLGTFWTSNSHIHVDRPTIDSRIWGWKYWKNDLEFMYHWNVLVFAYDVELGYTNPWESVSYKWGAGGVTLFYPPCKSGRCNSFNGNIIPSIRSEMFRDALDDYDSIVILEDLIQRAQLRNIDTAYERAILNSVKGLTQDLSSWTRNVPRYEEARIGVLQSITTLSAALQQ